MYLFMTYIDTCTYIHLGTKYVTMFMESCDLLIRTLLSEAAARFNQVSHVTVM